MNQGEIWLINLDPAIGAEIRKTRPAIIVSDNSLGKLPLRVIVPVTDWKEKYSLVPWMVRIVPDNHNYLVKISSADCFQIRSISENRFIRKLGRIENETLQELQEALAKVLSIPF